MDLKKPTLLFQLDNFGATVHWFLFYKCVIAFVAIVIVVALIVKFIGMETIVPLISGFIKDNSVASDSIDTWYGFLIHNGCADFIILAIGLIPFIPLSVLLMIYNSTLLGIFVSLNSMITSHSLFVTFLFGVAPHGILEYAVNCISFALGIYLCKTVTNRICKKESDDLKMAILNCLRVFVLFVLQGLLLAGIIEANITPHIINQMLH